MDFMQIKKGKKRAGDEKGRISCAGKSNPFENFYQFMSEKSRIMRGVDILRTT
jgi:hypothetical protein